MPKMTAHSYHNYEKAPCRHLPSDSKAAFSGWPDIAAELLSKTREHKKTVVVLECYPGTNLQECIEGLAALSPALLLFSEDCVISEEELTERFQYNLTDDRVFGHMTTAELSDYFRSDLILQARDKIEQLSEGICIVIGTGASLISQGDILIYADLSRWEIQLRYRKGMGNWHCSNQADPQLSKYKRGFFIEWRLADRLKESLLSKIGYLLDTNRYDDPAMLTGDFFRSALSEFASAPLRTVPYFDPGPWGGQWMKEMFDLDPSQKNYAWSFDGVPEENSLLLEVSGIRVEFPAMDLVLYAPEKLLGKAVYGRFGAEFPIRFDLLDTMDGGNLSLQVHPLTSYIQQKFGMHYTQDESYYILDCEEDACVYLGVKTGTNPEEMTNALKEAQETGEFDVTRYINQIPVKKHDHVLIPAGTIHCSGRNAMVLEVSATPYIFTFKLYDWGRLGMDGKPRPIHIAHGEKVIQWNRDTQWVEENAIHQEKTLFETKGYKKEHTGLHSLEFIETTRHWFDHTITLYTNGSVNMLNLVEGEEAIVESPQHHFEPFVVHYAETFIVPASVSEYTIRPSEKTEGKKVAVLQASVRTGENRE